MADLVDQLRARAERAEAELARLLEKPAAGVTLRDLLLEQAQEEPRRFIARTLELEAEIVELRTMLDEQRHALALERRMHALAERDLRARIDGAEVDPPPPMHAFEVFVRAGGHGWEATLDELVRIVDHVEHHGPCGCELVSGLGYVKIERRPEQTAQRYRAELDRWMAARRAPAAEPEDCRATGLARSDIDPDVVVLDEEDGDPA